MPDAQKQIGGPAVLGHPSLHQLIGDSVAMAAAAVMGGALGSAQNATTSNEMGLQNQSLLGTDPLTHHLAKMWRSQLTDIVSELKAIATQNKEQSQQLLLAFPNFPKALFQLQMPNIRQASAQPVLPLVQNGQTLPGLPPLPQNKMQMGMLPYAKESRVSTGVLNQYATLQKFPTPQLTQNQVIQQGQLLAQSGVSPHPSVHPQSINGPSVGQVHASTSSSFNQQMQYSLPHSVTSVPPTNSWHNDRKTSQNVNALASKLVHPQYSAASFQVQTFLNAMVQELQVK
ncbi:hypothetical protein ACS0TY_033594 [Phlomoides rotata]